MREQKYRLSKPYYCFKSINENTTVSILSNDLLDKIIPIYVKGCLILKPLYEFMLCR